MSLARALGLAALCLVGAAAAALPAPTGPEAPVEDWAGQPAGAAGVPAGWERYETPGGRPRYDFRIVDDDGRRALRLRSRGDRSTIARPVQVDLRATPILEWSWKVLGLPPGADIRSRATSDLTGHVLLAWPRVPALLRTRLIGYVWEATVPAGAMERSRKTGLVTFFVVRSGAAGLGRWTAERRDVARDYVAAFGGPPEGPAAVAISIDTNDTGGPAEALIGTIAFRARRPGDPGAEP